MSRPAKGNRGRDFGSKATTGKALATCACGKHSYDTRASAKERARLVPGQKLNIYQCGPYWHIGHLPQSVRNGEFPKEEFETIARARRST